MEKHAFYELAEVQRETKTMYGAGLDPHPFKGGWHANYDIYGRALDKKEEKRLKDEVYPYYLNLVKLTTPIKEPGNFAMTLSIVECYTLKVIDIMVKKCNIRVFKPQAGFYEQFGPLGMIMLSRIRQHIRNLEANYGRIICMLDCKRGDIATTQTAYFLGLMGNLNESWGVDYAPYDFDIMNVTPWMGLDVMAFGDEKESGLGLNLMKDKGKGIIVVNSTSNPTGPRYQKQIVVGEEISVQLLNVRDLALLSDEYHLDYDGLSSIGLVVGSTRVSTGNIRKEFPTTTLLVPGFGPQGGKFANIMQELIPSGKHAGQGAIFSLSRGSMYSFEAKLGGSGYVKNLEKDMITSVGNFRIAEKNAFAEPGLKERGIIYPF